MSLVHISIFVLLNLLIYFVIKHYKSIKLQIIFILFLIIVLKYLSNSYKNEETILFLIQLSKFSISIPIFILFINLLKAKVKSRHHEKPKFLNFIWNENTNFPLIITAIILSYQIFMLLTGMFKILI